MENIPFFISPPYQVFKMIYVLSFNEKTTAVSEFKPNSLKFSTLAFEAHKIVKSGFSNGLSSAGLMNMFLTK